MNIDNYNDLIYAGGVLCAYCQAHPDACNCCMITHLLDDAFAEALNSGIIDNYDDEEE